MTTANFQRYNSIVIIVLQWFNDFRSDKMSLRPVNDTEIMKGKAVIYLRYSSDNQNETSIEYQRRACEEIAEKYGLEIIDEYVDEEKSGRGECTYKRTRYLEMKKDILNKSQRPERVICYKIDRLGRNTQEIINCFTDFRNKGTTVITTEMDFNVPNAIAFIMFFSMMAESESNNISTRTADASFEKAQKGYFLGGLVPLGYKSIAFPDPSTKKGTSYKLIIDDNTAPIVKNIFEKYAYTNCSANDVCKWLNDELKFYNNNGGRWYKQTLINLLKKPTYKGTQLYHSQKKNYNTNTYEERVVELDDTIPAIVSKELWNMVQIKLSNNANAPRNVKTADTSDSDRFLLTNYLHCGHCGGTMSGSSSTRKLADGTYKKYRYYECVNKHSYDTCNKQSMDKYYLENFVITACLNLINDDNIDDTADKILKLYNIRYADKSNEKSEKELKKLQKKLINISNLLADEDIVNMPIIKAKYKADLKTTQAKIDEITEKLKQAESTNKFVPTINTVKKWLQRIKKSADTLQGKQQIIRAFVKSVYLTDENIIIYFNIDDTPDPDFNIFKKTLKENNLTRPNPTAPKTRKKSTKNFVTRQERGASMDGSQNVLNVINYTLYSLFYLV